MDQLDKDAIRLLIWDVHMMFDQSKEPWTKNRCQSMLMHFKTHFPEIYDAVADEYLKRLGL